MITQRKYISYPELYTTNHLIDFFARETTQVGDQAKGTGRLDQEMAVL
jgi:hypothetical protein